ncbi:SIR2 family NAD-dependent protein deacylase [Singulisphaera acidiphila]|uniref:NAD-dependent protein deacylase n=1 Tax=Singulisphaera acidiphila (strain ATCC BAA-1392 / DSM 18658 / VKM B-2454 / MOB10) TaxID=886293 RepID=L0DRG0_SINAD|nr:NAD-dependent deacylase [Singulisphaera acidiphila]AGA30961.1 NAD-dependent protein deacetylase, SIR2 family [Singulisphaera acidiphila DSM 18658]
MTDLEKAAKLLAKAGSVAVLTGAGISAESGIPTFRGLGGLWNGRDPMSLATPQAFAANPALVWEFYNWRRELVTRAEPNPGHRALTELAGKLTCFTLVTQNVDRLHQRAGSRDVLELHGNLFEVRCTGCGQTFDRDGETLPPLPHCEVCGQLLRPGVVWFGETLPPAIWEAAEAAVRQARLLLVVGTSAVVYPAAGLVATAQSAGGAVIEINLEPTPISDEVDLALHGKAAAILPLLTDLL